MPLNHDKQVKHQKRNKANPVLKRALYQWQQFKAASPLNQDSGNHVHKSMPYNRTKHACCVAGHFIYLLAGKDGNLTYKDLWQYNTDDGVWTQLQTSGNQPPSLQGHTILHHQGKLLVFGGGFITKEIDDAPLWVLDLDTLVWHHHIVGEVMVPEQRRDHTAVMYEGVMYVYGGFIDLLGSSEQLWAYDIKEVMWHMCYSYHLSSRPGAGAGARHDHTAVVYKRNMIVYGGMNNLTTKADLWIWSFDFNTWNRIKAKNGPCARHGHSACMVSEFMIVYGGEYKQKVLRDLWMYNYDTQEWSEISPLCVGPPPLVGHSMLMVSTSVEFSSGDTQVPVLRSDVAQLISPQPHVSIASKPTCLPFVNSTNAPFTRSNNYEKHTLIQCCAFNSKIMPLQKSNSLLSLDQSNTNDSFISELISNGNTAMHTLMDRSIDSVFEVQHKMVNRQNSETLSQLTLGKSVDSVFDATGEALCLMKRHKESLSGVDNPTYLSESSLKQSPPQTAAVDPVKSDAAYLVFSMKSTSLECLLSVMPHKEPTPLESDLHPSLPGSVLQNIDNKHQEVPLFEKRCTVYTPQPSFYETIERFSKSCEALNTQADRHDGKPIVTNTNACTTAVGVKRHICLEQRKRRLEMLKGHRKKQEKLVSSVYMMGGREPGAQNLIIKPMMVWKLNIPDHLT